MPFNPAASSYRYLAGIWSQIKRAPQAVKKRKTFEVPGPSVQGAMPLDARARQIFRRVTMTKPLPVVIEWPSQ